MNNKYNIQIKVPALYKTYDLLIPKKKTISDIIKMLEKGLKLITKDSFTLENLDLYNSYTGEKYNKDEILESSTINNGCILILC